MQDQETKDQSGTINDISVNEIREKGFNSLLQSRIPLSYFLIYTLDRKCAELLVSLDPFLIRQFFYLDAKLFQTIQFANEQEQFERAHRIYRTFIKTRDVLEVNLTAEIVLKIESVFRECLPAKDREPSVVLKNVFNEACSNVSSSLTGVYSQWICSDSYNSLISDIDRSATVHSRGARQVAASRLLKFFDLQRQCIDSSPHSMPKSSFPNTNLNELFAMNEASQLSKSVSPYSPARETCQFKMTPREYEIFYWLSNAFCMNKIGFEFVE